MHIIVDAMGGDHAPEAIVRGAAAAAKDFDMDVTLVGDSAAVESVLAACPDRSRIRDIVHTDEVITMEDDPLMALRKKKNASMPTALRMLKEEGDAMVSAGSTGALIATASHYIRPIKGIRRAAIATVLPMPSPVLLMDSGANLGYNTEYDVQWAVMGSIYMKNVAGVEKPRVALLNNGTEPCKGVPEVVEAYKILSEREDIHFVGNLEARDIPFGKCDVLITDGFTGNVVIKLMEGMGSFMKQTLKEVYTSGVAQKLAYLPVKKPIKEKFSAMSGEKVGGAPILGLNRPVIKAHGNSKEEAFYYALRQAKLFAETGVIEEIRASLPEMVMAE